MADSCWCMAENNTILWRHFPSIKNKWLKKKKPQLIYYSVLKNLKPFVYKWEQGKYTSLTTFIERSIGRRWDGWMASPTQWTWVWASSRRWWRTGKFCMLQSIGSQRVRHDQATKQQQHAKEWNWITSIYYVQNSFKCMKDFKIIWDCKPLEENTGGKLFDIDLDNDFLDTS